MFVEHELTDQPVGVSSRSGRTEPLHCTTLGKALITDLDREALTRLLGRGRLPAHTGRTITSIADLLRECERAGLRGYAVDDVEFREGVRCVAAPIRDLHGDIVPAAGTRAARSQRRGGRRGRQGSQFDFAQA